MKTTFLIPGLLGGALVLPVVTAQDTAPVPAGPPASPPVLDHSQVTIPYSELKALWAAAAQIAQPAPEPAPPVAAVLASADYELDLAGGRARLAARYQVRSLADGWQLVPLLGGDARLENTGRGQTEIVWRNGSYHFLTRGRGEHELELHFALGAPAAWRNDGLRLTPGTASTSRLRVSGIPSGQAVQVAELTATAFEGDSTIFHLPGGAEEIVISLESIRETEALPPPEPSTWTIQSEIFTRYSEGRLRYECRLHCQADAGAGLAMNLALPANALDVSLEGDDILDVKLGPRQDGARLVAVRWQTRDVLDRIVLLDYAVPQSPLAATWQIVPPRAAEDNAGRSLVAIAAVEGLELAGDKVMDAVHSRRLPEWLRTKVGAADFLTIETDASAELQANWLPRLETAQAIVQLASYESRLVSDGALLVQAQFTLAHRAPLSWLLELPAYDEILTCDVAGVAAQPLKRGENTIEFALATPDEGVSKVSLCYAARLGPLDRVSGRCALELPRTALFVHDLTWALSIPADYQTTALEGNLVIDRRPDSTSQPSDSILHLRKQLLRDEHPAVELYYQRRGLEE